MSEHTIGDVVIIDVDGKQTPAMVLAVDEHGALDLRVFGPTSEQDTVRRAVDESGEPFPYPQPDDARHLAAVPGDASPVATNDGSSDAAYQQFLEWQAAQRRPQPAPPTVPATPGTV